MPCTASGARSRRRRSQTIERAKTAGGRAVAVGTTSVRRAGNRCPRGTAGAVSRPDRFVYPTAVRVSSGRRAVDELSPAAHNAVGARFHVRRRSTHPTRLPGSHPRRIPLLQLRRRHAHPVTPSATRIDRHQHPHRGPSRSRFSGPPQASSFDLQPPDQLHVRGPQTPPLITRLVMHPAENVVLAGRGRVGHFDQTRKDNFP